MGLFDLFKSKRGEEAPALNKDAYSLANFNCYYLYGLTNDPFRQSNNSEAFGLLYHRVIGNKGGIVIAGSYHPYQLVNMKRATVWHAAYVQLSVNEKKEELFNAIIKDNAQLMSDPSASFSQVNVWPDTRLTYDENPVFSKYVPFVIPFLVYKTEEEMQWYTELREEMAGNGNASGYVSSLNDNIRFFMPSPAFILGFDEFDESKPSVLIDNFINCKALLKA